MYSFMVKKNTKEKHLIQGILLLLIIVLINYISSNTFYRFDLTSEKRYTLSGVSKDLLGELDDVFYIKVYLDGDIPIGFKHMAKSVKELLDEFRIYAKDNIQYEFVNPSSEEDAEIRNRVYANLNEKGLKPTNVHLKDKEGSTREKIIFPGAIIHYKNIEFPLNLLKNNPGLSAEVNLNNSIQSLEYEFIKAIYNLNDPVIRKVAFIEGHGELNDYEVGDITRELANYYQVDRGVINGNLHILDGYKVIIIAKPMKKFSEADKLVIDQYIMNGGKVVWCLDAVKVSMDSLMQGMTFAFINDNNLSDQLFKYGVRLNPTLIKDLQCAIIPVNMALRGNTPNFTPAPWVYYPLIFPNEDHPITKSLNVVKLEFPGSIDTVGGNTNVDKTFLLTSSEYSTTMNVPAIISLEEIKEQPRPDQYTHSNQHIAILMEGEFESVFAHRILSDIVPGAEKNFKRTSVETKMVVIADGDIIRNDVRYSAQGPLITPLGYDRYSNQTYGNKEFILNVVNYLTDEAGIMMLRGREFKIRLLNKAKLKGVKKVQWQVLNILVPVFVIILFGVLYTYLREKKYTKS